MLKCVRLTSFHLKISWTSVIIEKFWVWIHEFCSHSFTHVSLLSLVSLFFLTHTSKEKKQEHVTGLRHTHTHTHMRKHRFLAVDQFKSANIVTWKPVCWTPVKQLTPSTGSLLPWQHAVGWLSEMQVKNPFPWWPAETCKTIKFFACVWLCVRNEWPDGCLCVLRSYHHSALYLIIPTNDETVSKGRDCSSLIDTSLCSVNVIDSHTHALTHAHTHTHLHVHSNRGIVPLVSPNDCSHHYLPVVYGCVRECGDMKRKQSLSLSVFRWMSSEGESHEPVPSAFFSPMNLPTRCLPPTSSERWWNFSASSPARFLTLCSYSPSYSHPLCFFILSRFLLQFLSLSHALIPELHLHISAIFSLFPSLHLTLAQSFLTGRYKLFLCLCVSAMCLHFSKTPETAYAMLGVSTVIVMPSQSCYIEKQPWIESNNEPFSKSGLLLD